MLSGESPARESQKSISGMAAALRSVPSGKGTVKREVMARLDWRAESREKAFW